MGRVWSAVQDSLNPPDPLVNDERRNENLVVLQLPWIPLDVRPLTVNAAFSTHTHNINYHDF
jgi:hypothetical protein